MQEFGIHATAGRLLHRSADLVERGWAREAEARSVDGSVVEPWEPAAVSWSLLGALVASVEEHDVPRGRLPLAALAAALAALADVVDDDSLAGWNDRRGRTQHEVVGVLRAAAAAV